MTTALSTESFLAMAIIMIAMLLCTLNVARVARWPWNSDDPQGDYLAQAVAPYFLAIASVLLPLLLAFFGGAFTLIMPGIFGQGSGETFGLVQAEAGILFAGVSLATIVLGGIAALRVVMVPKTQATEAITFIGMAFTCAGAVFAFILSFLAFFGSMPSDASGIIDGAMSIAAGAVIATVCSAFLRGWLVGQLKDTDFDPEVFGRGTVIRAAVLAVLSGLPMLAGIVMIAV